MDITQDYEKLISRIKQDKSGTTTVTIPKEWVKYIGLESGDRVKLWIRKIGEFEEDAQ